MYNLVLAGFLSAMLTLIVSSCKSQNESLNDRAIAEYWLTTPDQSVLFEKRSSLIVKVNKDSAVSTIQIDTSVCYQVMDGFGYTLTGGSALWLNKMTGPARTSILKELFSTDGSSIGISYLRISIGASDLDEKVFSYNDIPEGETDPDLDYFTLDPDREHLIPVLKEILTINPDLKIMGSPWSAPTWMKTNKSAIGGSLLPEYFECYSQYFVKYIKGMQEEGIRIDAITVQNEPLHPGNNPSMYMPAKDQALFIKKYLGPALKKENLDTKIIIYDHNADRIDYPLSILNDPEANKYIDGSAFHLYGGKIEALTQVYNAFPEKKLYFTEQWIGAPSDFGGDLVWHTEQLIIGASRNWCSTVLEWNLAADPDQEPHTDQGGCTRCLGAITIDGDIVERNTAYYIIAHASKFVHPGAQRISSTIIDKLPNVAFRTMDKKIVLIVLNSNSVLTQFNITLGEINFLAELPAGSVGTYIF